MLRRTGLIAAATALLAAPALSAEPGWSTYGSFAKTRCEDKATLADIRTSLDGLTFNEGGGATFATASKIAIARSKTLKATASQLVCQLTMRTIEAGDTYSYRVRFTVTLKPDGTWRTLYQPNY